MDARYRTLALSLLVLASAFALPAAGVVTRNTNAGAACQPRYPGARAFAAGNHSLRNTGDVDQYVVCHFGQMDLGPEPQSPASLAVHASAGALAGQVICIARTGYFDGAVQTSAASTRAAQVASGGSTVLSWTAADLPRSSVADALTLECKVPAGFTVGLIELADPEPASGTGWSSP